MQQSQRLVYALTLAALALGVVVVGASITGALAQELSRPGYVAITSGDLATGASGSNIQSSATLPTSIYTGASGAPANGMPTTTATPTSPTTTNTLLRK